MSYRNISISAILHALAIAHRNRFTDSETPRIWAYRVTKLEVQL